MMRAIDAMQSRAFRRFLEHFRAKSIGDVKVPPDPEEALRLGFEMGYRQGHLNGIKEGVDLGVDFASAVGQHSE